MCFGLFIASASIFLARPQLFPALLSKTHILFVLGILPLVFMVFWLGHILLTKRIQENQPTIQNTRSSRGIPQASIAAIVSVWITFAYALIYVDSPTFWPFYPLPNAQALRNGVTGLERFEASV